MSSILSYGTYFPRFRVEENVLSPKSGKKGSRSVAYTDEDIITLAYEAVKDCFKNNEEADAKNVDAVFFATTSPVFSNRYHASFLADLLELPKEIFALDFSSTPRAGTDALILAAHLVDANIYSNILVVAGEIHFPETGEEAKNSSGHAACALWIGKEKGIAKIKHSYSLSCAIAEEYTYKNAKISLDPRFSRDAAFKTNIKSALEKISMTPDEFDAVILNSLYSRLAGGIFTGKGFSDLQFSKDDITASHGYTGSCHALLQLVSALKNGSKNILLFDYYNGTNVLSILAGKSVQIRMEPDHNKIKIETYQDYLSLRKAGNFNSLKYRTTEMFSSEMMNEREKQASLYLYAFECEECKTKYFIRTARCKKCKCNRFSIKKLQDSGTIYTFTREYYFPGSFPPITMAVIDLDGGGRITVQLTDDMYATEKNKITTGSRVRLVLRKMMEHDEKPGYFFKCVVTE